MNVFLLTKLLVLEGNKVFWIAKKAGFRKGLEMFPEINLRLSEEEGSL